MHPKHLRHQQRVKMLQSGSSVFKASISMTKTVGSLRSASAFRVGLMVSSTAVATTQSRWSCCDHQRNYRRAAICILERQAHSSCWCFAKRKIQCASYFSAAIESR